MTTDTELFTKADVAKQLGITPAAIYKAEREGRIVAAAKTAGGVRLYTPESVEAFRVLRAQRRAAKQPKG